jgi:hypothetical protein
VENNNANIELAVTRWLEIAIKRYRFYIHKNKVGFSQNLWNSFTENIIRGAGGDIAKLEISFLFYGRFVDMGSSRGWSFGRKIQPKIEQIYGFKKLKGEDRKPKKWYSKTTSFEVHRLAQILADEFGVSAPNLVTNTLKGLESKMEL